MSWALTALVVLGLLGWAWRTGAPSGRRSWRLLAPAFALVALVGGVLSLLRGGWPVGLLLLAAGLALASAARTPPARSGSSPGASAPGSPPDPATQGVMTLAAARAVLGVPPDASREDILAAHARLIRRIHPDAGGTDGLAAHLNAARDRLLEA